MSMDRETLLTRKQAAEYLGLNPQTLADWACTGRVALPYVRIGRAARYRATDLQAFVESNTVFHTGQLRQAKPR